MENTECVLRLRFVNAGGGEVWGILYRFERGDAIFVSIVAQRS